jgi:hypothetical protein
VRAMVPGNFDSLARTLDVSFLVGLYWMLDAEAMHVLLRVRKAIFSLTDSKT